MACHRLESAICQILIKVFTALRSLICSNPSPRRLLGFGVPREKILQQPEQSVPWILRSLKFCLYSRMFSTFLDPEMLVQGRIETWFRIGKLAFCLLELL